MTEITLRKANAIQAAINDTLKAIQINTAVQINEFQDPQALISDARLLLFKNHTRQIALLDALYAIRSLVGVENATSGIGAKLAKAAQIDKLIAQLTTISAGAVQLSGSEIIGKLEKLKTGVTESWNRADDSITTGLLVADEITNFKNAILTYKKQKQLLNDLILESNIKQTIKLPDDVVQTLTDEQLL
jgi:hypothetical protein